uniref:Uncharacterized protein n=1 Tax=Leersia perrieri TaxID=77586 RepID=A0A0D9WW06_9ORYZ
MNGKKSNRIDSIGFPIGFFGTTYFEKCCSIQLIFLVFSFMFIFVTYTMTLSVNTSQSSIVPSPSLSGSEYLLSRWWTIGYVFIAIWKTALQFDNMIYYTRRQHSEALFIERILYASWHIWKQQNSAIFEGLLGHGLMDILAGPIWGYGLRHSPMQAQISCGGPIPVVLLQLCSPVHRIPSLWTQDFCHPHSQSQDCDTGSDC